jgi:hypothetical protein
VSALWRGRRCTVDGAKGSVGGNSRNPVRSTNPLRFAKFQVRRCAAARLRRLMRSRVAPRGAQGLVVVVVGERDPIREKPHCMVAASAWACAARSRGLGCWRHRRMPAHASAGLGQPETDTPTQRSPCMGFGRGVHLSDSCVVSCIIIFGFPWRRNISPETQMCFSSSDTSGVPNFDRSLPRMSTEKTWLG